MNNVKIIALSKDASHFDQTWGLMLRDIQQQYRLFESLSEFNKLKQIDCDLFIIDNDLKESIKGATLIRHLRKVGKLSFGTVVLLTSSLPKEFYSFKNIDIRPDFISPSPFQMNSAKKCYESALNAIQETRNLRLAFSNNDLEKTISESRKITSKVHQNFTKEVLAEAYCKMGIFSDKEAELLEILKEEIWPAYVLAREYSREENLNKFSHLISETKNIHNGNIGLSYLYLQGNVMLQNAEYSDEEFSLSRNNDYFNAPEYLYWISKFEYKREKFKQALASQLEYINDKSETSLENCDDYKLLATYTEAYLLSDERKDNELLENTVCAFNSANKRNILNESLSIAAIKFEIRLKMLQKDYSMISSMIIDMYNKHSDTLKAYPKLMNDIIYTVSNSVELSDVRNNLLKNKEISHALKTSRVMNNEKINSLLLNAKEKINNHEYSDAELILSKILRNDKGNIDASFMMSEIKIHLANINKSKSARKNFLGMAMQIMEDSNHPSSEWERNRKIEIINKIEQSY